jgi:hypothetical protein
MDSETASSVYLRDKTGLTGEERIGARFQPDSLLSAQYFETLRRKTILEPEKRLMLAILEDAIDCLQNNVLAQSLKSRRLFQEAVKWIVEVDADWVFSFENVCDALALNPAYVRQGFASSGDLFSRHCKRIAGCVNQEKNQKLVKVQRVRDGDFEGKAVGISRQGNFIKPAKKFKENRL